MQFLHRFQVLANPIFDPTLSAADNQASLKNRNKHYQKKRISETFHQLYHIEQLCSDPAVASFETGRAGGLETTSVRSGSVRSHGRSPKKNEVTDSSVGGRNGILANAPLAETLLSLRPLSPARKRARAMCSRVLTPPRRPSCINAGYRARFARQRKPPLPQGA